MKRVMVVGQPGAGKSTLAREIGAATGLPVVHMDMLHWMDGWVERDRAERARLVAEVEASDAWVLDGNYSLSWQNRVARADTYIWIDLPVGLRLWRVILRIVKSYGRSRPDLPAGCPERFDWEFMRYIWTTRHSRRVMLQEVVDARYPHLTVYHLASPKQVDAFLTELGHTSAHE